MGTSCIFEVDLPKVSKELSPREMAVRLKASDQVDAIPALSLTTGMLANKQRLGTALHDANEKCMISYFFGKDEVHRSTKLD